MVFLTLCVLVVVLMLGAAACFRLSRTAALTIAGAMWLLYLPYEYLMYRRVLCSGECNIRPDLLLIYPTLIFTTLAALARTVATHRQRRQPTSTH